MNQEQNSNNAGMPQYVDRHAVRAQARLERFQAKQAAKQAAREARYAYRQTHPRRDWTFEVRLGDQVITFNWRWGSGLDVQATPVEPQPAAETPSQEPLETASNSEL